MKGVLSLQVPRAASSRARQRLLPAGGLVGGAHRPVSSSAPPQQKKQHVSFKDMAYANPLGLPRLPIPDLEDTVSRYLEVRASKMYLQRAQRVSCGESSSVHG